MSAADRTSRLLDKLQQVEAIGEGARQAMRQENVELAAHEEELLEQVHFDSVMSVQLTLNIRSVLLLQMRILEIDISSKVSTCSSNHMYTMLTVPRRPTSCAA
jgi:hypothetical protein